MEMHNDKYNALKEENRRLREELRHAMETHRRHIEEIADIQQKLLPQPSTAIPGIDFSASYRPLVNAGGDYYDVVPLPATSSDPASTLPCWGAIIADASGHGPAAAIEIAMLDAILRTYTAFSAGPAAVLNYINKHFFTRQIRKDFITAFVVSFDPMTQVLRYANAGHLPGLLIAADGSRIEPLSGTTGIPLGVQQQKEWSDAETEITSGDILVLFTDGIIEARSASGEHFGNARLESLLQRTWSDTDQILTTVFDELDAFRGSNNRCDDESLVAIRIK